VGVRRFLAALQHEETALSRWEGVGERSSIGDMDCERAGETCLRGAAEMFNNARTFSFMRRRFGVEKETLREGNCNRIRVVANASWGVRLIRNASAVLVGRDVVRLSYSNKYLIELCLISTHMLR